MTASAGDEPRDDLNVLRHKCANLSMEAMSLIEANETLRAEVEWLRAALACAEAYLAGRAPDEAAVLGSAVVDYRVIRVGAARTP